MGSIDLLHGVARYVTIAIANRALIAVVLAVAFAQRTIDHIVPPEIYLFGKADVSPFYAIHDEDALEFPYTLQAGNGLKRCRDRSKRGYERYVVLGILGRNLQTLGKLLLARDAADCQAAKSKRKREAG